MIEQAILAQLQASAAVTAIIGTNIYPNDVREGEVDAYVCYRQSGAEESITYSGRSTIDRFDFICVPPRGAEGAHYMQAKALATAVRDCFGSGFTAAGFCVRKAEQIDRQDGYDYAIPIHWATVRMAFYHNSED